MRSPFLLAPHEHMHTPGTSGLGAPGVAAHHARRRQRGQGQRRKGLRCGRGRPAAGRRQQLRRGRARVGRSRLRGCRRFERPGGGAVVLWRTQLLRRRGR